MDSTYTNTHKKTYYIILRQVVLEYFVKIDLRNGNLGFTRVAYSCHLDSQAEFVQGPGEFKSIKTFKG